MPGNVEVESEQNGVPKNSKGVQNSRAGRMPVRYGSHRDRFPRALGVARSFRREPPCAWRGLCDLRGQLAQPIPRDDGTCGHHALQGANGG